jgi:hypothetical protein
VLAGVCCHRPHLAPSHSRPGLNYSAVDVGTLTAHVGLLASYGLSIDLSVSLTANVSGLIAVMAASPNATFVLDHMGYVPVGASPAQVRVPGVIPRSRGPKITEGGLGSCGGDLAHSIVTITSTAAPQLLRVGFKWSLQAMSWLAERRSGGLAWRCCQLATGCCPIAVGGVREVCVFVEYVRG